MKCKIIKKLFVFGLVCGITLGTMPISAVAAGTKAESATGQPETSQETETSQAETYTPETEQAETTKSVETVLDQTEKTARAAEGELNISGGTEGTDYTVSGTGVITVLTDTPLTIAGESGWEYTGRIVVEAKEASLTLSGVTLKSESGSVLTVQEGSRLDLTIEWDNKLSVEVSNTYAVTLETGAELCIGGTGKLTLSVPDDSMAKDISMSRGNKKDDDSEETDTPAVLKITGGTVTAQKGIDAIGTENQKVSVQITGGSVALKTPNKNSVSVTNDKRANVYKKIITLSEANAQVEDLTVNLDGYTYGTEGIYTNKNKEIFIYLPAGDVSLNVENTEYSGTVTKDDEDDERELSKTASSLQIEAVSIPEVEYGYTSSDLTAATVTIKNTSANGTTVTAEVAGGDSKYFELTQSTATVPGSTGTTAGVSTEIQIRPKTIGLDAGTYTENLKVTGADGSSAEIAVTFTVNKVKVTLTSSNVTIDEKVYDGKKAASGTITMPEIDGKTPEIDQSKVTYKFNSANVKEATTVTVSGIALTETWAKNYELTQTELEVAATITKAANTHDKDDLKAPSVTTVYNSSTGLWQPKLTTYKGQEYLFFGTTQTSLTNKNKKSSNWKFGDKGTVKNRLVTISGGLKTGVTYTVWTRFAADDNHEASDGEVMTYTTFTVSSTGTVTDENGNTITGLTEGTTYKTGSRLAFGAVGAGMSNTSPESGDVRYLPVSWKVSEEHTWSSAPYEAAFTINQAGSYTLQVTFRKQTYTNGAWTNTSTTSVTKVNFKMAASGANGTGYTTTSSSTSSTTSSGTTGSTSSTAKTTTSTAAKTGDDSPLLPMAVIFMASAAVLSGYIWKRRVKQR